MLKYLVMLAGTCLSLAAVAGPITIPANAGTRLAAAEGAITTNAAAIAAVQSNMVAQVDTNATTDVTTYTPRIARGDVLVGSKGAGTNAVWIAKGATTNDWVQIAPAVTAE